MSLPEGYIKGIERVSNIVSFLFPFDGNSKKRYQDWLDDNVSTGRKRGFAIDEKDYLKEAQTVGTFVHQQIEDFILGKKLDNKSYLARSHKKEVINGIKYVSSLPPDSNFITEKVICDERLRYQGTIDLVRIDEENKTVWLYDWKTWGIAKKRWGINNGVKKPYGKLDKVALQLSLYAEYYRKKGYSIGGIYVIWLHEDGAFEYKLDLWESISLDELINNFNKGKEPSYITEFDITLKYEEMEVRINTPIPGKQYSNAEIIVQKDDFDGKTFEEKIDEAIGLQKYLLDKYK